MPSTKAISVRNIPESLWQAVRIEAMKRGLSVSEFLIELLKDATAPNKGSR